MGAKRHQYKSVVGDGKHGIASKFERKLYICSHALLLFYSFVDTLLMFSQLILL